MEFQKHRKMSVDMKEVLVIKNHLWGLLAYTKRGISIGIHIK